MNAGGGIYPWLVWNVFFPLHEWAKGHPTYRLLREMEAADRLTFPERERLTWDKLRAFIEYCYAHVPYVRAWMKEAGLKPSDVEDSAGLARLPVLTKADVRKHRASLRSEIAGSLASSSTGGSTGEPLLFDLSKERIASRVACRQRVSRWWGLSVGVPELAIWGSPVEASRQDLLRHLRDRLLATRLLSAYEMTEPVISRYLDAIESGRSRQIFAYPSTMYLLCLHARKQGRDLRRGGVKAVFVTGEVLYPYQRQLIAETMGCPVADGYGGRDSGFIAHECPEGGMHVMADAVIVEIVDSLGRPLPAGETGEIVVTDLHSREAPFLRYATGDVGALSARRCPCGRPLPLLEKLEGRSNDAVLAADGRLLHPSSLLSVLREIEGIEQVRIYQRRTDGFHVQLVSNGKFRREFEDRIRELWSKRLRSPLQVTFEYLAELPRERSGKFRHIVSELAAAGAGLRGKPE